MLDPVWLFISNLIFARSSFKKWTSLDNFINLSPKSLFFSQSLFWSSIIHNLALISFKSWNSLFSFSSDLTFFSSWSLRIECSFDMNFSYSGSLIFSFLISKIEILSKSSPTETSTIILFIKFYTMLNC